MQNQGLNDLNKIPDDVIGVKHEPLMFSYGLALKQKHQKHKIKLGKMGFAVKQV